MKRFLIALTVLVAVLIPTPAADASPRQEAERALADAQFLLEGDASASTTGAPETPASREASAVLRRLAVLLPRLDAADRKAARRILARPTSPADPDYFGNEAAASPLCDAHFCVHWGSGDDAPPRAGGGDGVPDFVEDTLAAAASSYAVENDTLDWNNPISDGSKGGGPEVDIHLTDLGRGLFGYAAPDPGQSGRKRSSYLVLDNDYSGFQGEPVALMQVTMAHEYNHVLQFGYDTFADLWMFESSATWAEDKVFPDVNDYLNFVGTFARKPMTPLAEEDRDATKLYGSAMWNHWLDARLGADVVRGIWERSPVVKPESFAVAAYDAEIGSRGGGSFASQFGEFAAATAEWNATGVFPDEGSYPDVARNGKLGPNPRKFKLDHTAYRLFTIKGDPGSRLKVKAPRKTRSAIALVGREGPRTGPDANVVISTKYLKKGGKASVRLPSGSGFDRLTAVVVNADGRVFGNGRTYTRDNRRYRASLTR